jgi:phospholipase C
LPKLFVMLTCRTFLQLMGASTGLAITGSELLTRAAASAAPLSPHGSDGIEHVVVLMMENRPSTTSSAGCRGLTAATT